MLKISALNFEPEQPKVMPSIIPIPSFVDDRGVLSAITNNMQPELWRQVKRVYTVYNHAPGTIRGFHYHKNEWKIFVTIRGAIKYLWVNPVDGKWDSTTTIANRSIIVIPPLWANGWQDLSGDSLLLSLSTATPEESKEDDWRIDPYYWGMNVWDVVPR